MKEFDYFGDAKVAGATLRAYLSAFGPYQKRGEQVLCRKFGVDEIVGEKDVWYSLADFLNALEEFQNQFGPEFMRKIGKALPDFMIRPQEYENTEQEREGQPPDPEGLKNIMPVFNTVYYMNHLAQPDEIGGYHWTKESEKTGSMVCDGPYPCLFDYAVIEYAAKIFCPSARVAHDDQEPCRHKGGARCVYRIEWEE